METKTKILLGVGAVIVVGGGITLYLTRDSWMPNKKSKQDSKKSTTTTTNNKGVKSDVLTKPKPTTPIVNSPPKDVPTILSDKELSDKLIDLYNRGIEIKTNIEGGKKVAPITVGMFLKNKNKFVGIIDSSNKFNPEDDNKLNKLMGWDKGFKNYLDSIGWAFQYPNYMVDTKTQQASYI